jgi:uncharacterized protein
VIYLDTSVALAQLLDEDRLPPPALWDQDLVSSRLLEYESWVVLHARKLSNTHGQDLQALLGHIAFLELEPRILSRALEPFPVVVRTLDALHLASLTFLRDQGPPPKLASYDDRLIHAAKRLKFEIFRL